MPGIFEMLASDPSRAPLISYKKDYSGAWCEVTRRGGVKASRRLRPYELQRLRFLPEESVETKPVEKPQ